mmetsp:Transcript_2376/g.3326  ORF Transcript_2376/g.3326 Transcript_2376/m.3326 type:complete len:83 (+) Transcript_2376:343-591(+)
MEHQYFTLSLSLREKEGEIENYMFETSFDVVEISVVGVDRVMEERERMGTFLEFGAQEDPIKAKHCLLHVCCTRLPCVYVFM